MGRLSFLLFILGLVPALALAQGLEDCNFIEDGIDRVSEALGVDSLIVREERSNVLGIDAELSAIAQRLTSFLEVTVPRYDSFSTRPSWVLTDKRMIEDMGTTLGEVSSIEEQLQVLKNRISDSKQRLSKRSYCRGSSIDTFLEILEENELPDLAVYNQQVDELKQVIESDLQTVLTRQGEIRQK